MVSQKYRWDFIGLSTDTKPTSETSDKVVNGSTYYCSDTSKLYVYCNGTWYERKPLGGGGGGGGSYIAGTGIDITDDTISLDSASQASLAKANTSVQNTDYASSAAAGIVRIGTATSTYLSGDNRLSATSRTYADYTSGSDAMFIGKGTLENVIAGKGLIASTDYASSSEGGTIKSSNSYGTKMANTGVLYANTFTYSGYQNTANDGAFIGKGTLENVIEGKGLVDQTALAGKQDTLTAGTGIDITNNVISATGGGGGGAITELTTADYDVTVSNVQGIALWRLPAGLYHTANDVEAFAGNGYDFKLSLNSHLIIIDDSGNQKLIKVVGDDFSNFSNGVYKGFAQYKVAASDGSGQFAQTESVISTASLMKKQGTTPTSSDVGFKGQLWYDSANNKLYINVNKPSDYSGNWKEISLAS